MIMLLNRSFFEWREGDRYDSGPKFPDGQRGNLKLFVFSEKTFELLLL